MNKFVPRLELSPPRASAMGRSTTLPGLFLLLVVPLLSEPAAFKNRQPPYGGPFGSGVPSHPCSSYPEI